MSIIIKHQVILHIEQREEQFQQYDEVHLSYIETVDGRELFFFTVTNGYWQLQTLAHTQHGKGEGELVPAALALNAGSRLERLVALVHDSQCDPIELINKYQLAGVI